MVFSWSWQRFLTVTCLLCVSLALVLWSAVSVSMPSVFGWMKGGRPMRKLPLAAVGLPCFCENPRRPDGDAIAFIQIHKANVQQWSYLIACAVATAAKHNPSRAVNVHTYPLLPAHPLWADYDNIGQVLLDPCRLANGTAAMEWYRRTRATDERTQFWLYHLSDLLRYLVLYKYGGVYLDTDVFTLRSYGTLRNALAPENPQQLVGNVMAFDARNPYLERLISAVPREYSANDWGSIGPALLTSVATQLFDFPSQNHSAEWNVTLLPTRALHPIHWTHNWMVFEPAQMANVSALTSGAYAFSFWRKAASREGRTVQPGSFIYHTLQLECPVPDISAAAADWL